MDENPAFPQRGRRSEPPLSRKSTFDELRRILDGGSSPAIRPNPDPLPDVESGIERLRELCRPKRVRVLLVGESSPANGKHFYRASSKLFKVTRQGFAQALGGASVPYGVDFLGTFVAHGWWLVDLADRPVNQLKTRQERIRRLNIVRQGIPRLTHTIEETRPIHVIAIGKTYVDQPMKEALRVAHHEPQGVSVLPFPRTSGDTADYIRGIRVACRRSLGDQEPGAAVY